MGEIGSIFIFRFRNGKHELNQNFHYILLICLLFIHVYLWRDNTSAVPHVWHAGSATLAPSNMAYVWHIFNEIQLGMSCVCFVIGVAINQPYTLHCTNRNTSNMYDPQVSSSPRARPLVSRFFLLSRRLNRNRSVTICVVLIHVVVYFGGHCLCVWPSFKRQSVVLNCPLVISPGTALLNHS